jgi:hypothetical protein
MKSKLIDHFGEDIEFYGSNGKSDIISLSSSKHSIIHQLYSSCNVNVMNADLEKMNKITEVGKIIRDDKKNLKSLTDTYDLSSLSSAEESLSFVPTSLQLLLSTINTSKINENKLTSVAQAIIQLVHPRNFIVPLQVSTTITQIVNMNSYLYNGYLN